MTRRSRGGRPVDQSLVGTLVLVTGSRNWSNRHLVAGQLDRLHFWGDRLNVMPAGLNRGADAIAAQWCRDHPDVVEENHWPTGPITRASLLSRNRAMIARRPDVVLAFVSPGSRGTWFTITEAVKAGLTVTAFTDAVVTDPVAVRARQAAAALLAGDGWKVARRRSLALVLAGLCVGDPLPPGIIESIDETLASTERIASC